MSQLRRRSFLLLGATALIAAGCGGGEEIPPTDPSAATTPPATTTTPGTTVAGAIDPVTGLPVAGAAPVASATTLPDLDGGNLGTGGLRGGGNPFKIGADESAAEVAGGAGTSSGISSGAGMPIDLGTGSSTNTSSPARTPEPFPTTTTNPSTTPATDPTTVVAPAVYGGAKIYVGGKTYNVDRGGSFPSGDPMFKLITVSATSVELELIAGEFSGGGVGVFLDKGDLVTLANASTGVNYKVKYLSPIEAATGINPGGTTPTGGGGSLFPGFNPGAGTGTGGTGAINPVTGMPNVGGVGGIPSTNNPGLTQPGDPTLPKL